ncbi:MAG: 4-phosphoerythronate dehydrogenase PdxB [Bacteroidota bacterium]|jgi:erythronate-4-phosphate dehydrogenase|nr:4-phosphoerythronate dehydrogenase PdxB [Bacteroidota bacterium]
METDPIKILADAHIPFLQGVAERYGEVEYLPGNQFTPDAVKEKDALIVRTVTRFNEEMLAGSRVKLICSATIGFDHIDTAYCDAQGIAWRTAPGCNASSVEQYVTASLLYLARKYRFQLNEKMIGIVGVGNVGSKVAVACEKLGMRVLLNDPPREELEGSAAFTPIETIQREADIITFHTPLTRDGKHKTYHLADSEFLSATARQPFIINAARGGVVDNRALIHALRDGNVSGAIIDCWENEPNIDLELLKLVDIATPHIAGYSADGKWNATKMSLEQLSDFFQLDVAPRYQEIPAPTKPLVSLHNVEPSQQLEKAVWHTYNPALETEALKAVPGDFYHFRSHYPLRREYPAHRVTGCDKLVAPLLTNLGFQIIR